MDLIDLGREALRTLLIAGAPLFLTALAVALLVGFFQAATQIHEAALSFIPKLVAVTLVLLVSGPWILARLMAFAESLWSSLGRFIS